MSLLIEINRYLAQTGMSPTRFGRDAVNDPRLVGDLRLGRKLGRKITTRVKTFIRRGVA